MNTKDMLSIVKRVDAWRQRGQTCRAAGALVGVTEWNYRRYKDKLQASGQYRGPYMVGSTIPSKAVAQGWPNRRLTRGEKAKKVVEVMRYIQDGVARQEALTQAGISAHAYARWCKTCKGTIQKLLNGDQPSVVIGPPEQRARGSQLGTEGSLEEKPHPVVGMLKGKKVDPVARGLRCFVAIELPGKKRCLLVTDGIGLQEYELTDQAVDNIVDAIAG